MTNVIELSEVKRGRVVTHYTVDEQVMNDIRLRMYKYDTNDLAFAMSVTPSCVRAIRNGRTKWPRGRTFFALLDALGLEFRLYDRSAKRYL